MSNETKPSIDELLAKVQQEVDSWPEWFRNNAELVLRTSTKDDEDE